MSEWISVDDRLPERPTQKVIVWYSRWYGPGFMSVAIFSGKWEFTESPEPVNGSVTHWMPLPPPPLQK